MIRQLITTAAIVVSAQGGCALFHDAAKPATYGGELASCETSSKGWDDYVPCCVDVARRYGRDPLFCIPDPSAADGGAK